MAVEVDLDAALSRLKVFPLPGGTLFPGAPLRLHVFEARYRALVRDALASDRIFSVAMLAPGWEADYHGRPPMLPVAGVGVIERCDSLSDGSFDLVVRGLARVRIAAEHPAVRPYREVEAERIEELLDADPNSLDSLKRSVLELGQRLPKDVVEPLFEEAPAARRPGALCDLIASLMFEDGPLRQKLLEMTRESMRVRVTLAEVGKLLAKAGAGPGQLLS